MHYLLRVAVLFKRCIIVIAVRFSHIAIHITRIDMCQLIYYAAFFIYIRLQPAFIEWNRIYCIDAIAIVRGRVLFVEVGNASIVSNTWFGT